jgi:hypothetical protein
MGSQVLSAKKEMWMHAWQHLLEVRLGTCIESRVNKTLHPTFNTSPPNCFYKIIKIQLLMIIKYIWNVVFKLGSCDFTSMLGLANMTRGVHWQKS